MNKKYSIILCDPPWSYNVWKGNTKKTAGFHYNVLTEEQLLRLNIQKICNDNCILFLWVTSPFLEFAFKLISEWGFTYKTVGFAWIKKTKNNKMHWGMGYWTRPALELCLLATKGKIKRIAKNVHQIIEYSILKHSCKPDLIRDRIVKLIGNLPKIELFATKKVKGWDSIGYEIDGKDIRDILKEDDNA